MKKLLIRRISLIAAIAFLVISFGINKMLAGQKEAPKKESQTTSVPLVNTFIAAKEEGNVYLHLTGRIIAAQKIDVYAEVTGRLLSSGKLFQEGASFKRGEALLHINSSDSRMNLIASRATFQSLLTQIQADLATDFASNFEAWSQYVVDFDPEKSVRELPNVTDQKEKNFLVAKNIYNQYYNIKSQEIKHAKHSVSAPFTGVVHNANATPGKLVRSGQKVGEFIGTSSFELEAGLSLMDQAKVKIGDIVTLSSADVDGEWMGKVSRIGKAIDQTTQTFKVYVTLESDALSEGMYMDAQFGGAGTEGTVRVPTNLLTNDGAVYTVVRDSVLQKHPIEIAYEIEGFSIVKGVPEGTVLLGQSLPGAADGMIVRVNKSQN
jgi:membrane fusion protein (multidrug efflux system)